MQECDILLIAARSHRNDRPKQCLTERMVIIGRFFRFKEWQEGMVMLEKSTSALLVLGIEERSSRAVYAYI